MELTDLATGGGTAIDLTQVGDTIEGVLVSVGEFRPIEGKFGVKMKAPCNLKVGDEDRTLWIPQNSRLSTVIGNSFKEAGLTSIVCGGTLKVRRVQDVPTNKGNPMHDFAAKYIPPVGIGPELDDF